MIHSMTGYGKAEVTQQEISCCIELRSVNHRFLDIRMKLPKAFQYFEENLKQTLKKFVVRGKIDVNIILENKNQSGTFVVNSSLVKSFKTAIQELEASMERKLHVSITNFQNIEDCIQFQTQDADQQEHESLLLLLIEKGVISLLEMRKKEGALLKESILKNKNQCIELIKKIKQYTPEIVKQYKKRLEKNLYSLYLGTDLENPRILQEIGIIADRSDITEEMDRFEAHIQHLEELIDQEEPVGRKLDFLMQEMNREANTICSKANHTKIATLGIELKSEIEKIREQIQNIE